MRLLTDLKSDLVDKKLWPIAALLLVALAAIPLLLGHGDGQEPAAAAPAPIATAARTETPVVLDAVVETATQHRAGRVRDPFAGNAKPAATTGASGAAATTTTPSTPAASSAPARTSTSASHEPEPAASTSPSAPAATTSTPAPATTTTSTSAAAPATTTYKLPARTTLRFGRSGAKRTFTDVARLTALPSAKQPFVYYAGTVKGTKKAIFLLSPGLTHSGRGRCLPSPEQCESLMMKAGQRALIGYADPKTGVTTHFALSLKAVRAAKPSSSKAAAARVSQAGRKLVTAARALELLPGASAWKWSARSGALVRAAKAR